MSNAALQSISWIPHVLSPIMVLECPSNTFVGGGILERLFDRFTGFTGAFLDPAKQFIVFAIGVAEIAIRELAPLLLQLAFGDVPVAFDFEYVHSIYFRFQSLPNVTAKSAFAVGIQAMLQLSQTLCDGD
jgi:hypothetical protein